jgi:hypothetical protein
MLSYLKNFENTENKKLKTMLKIIMLVIGK